ncbi:MAG TPA: bifunctional diaminohydroxyphosphoribosylaminopyrimidine deaminase/5-amino-6-(5-phosphoribosylamino)uracil reductase RibD [Bacteroidales bacterium]|nr:bifunctional diaminohydroxyphosphoribosylaminopyrimidine deaminase/5-amino-6-(5-phosphoribosylamino)uracil reductase RibD [Bacteroidales bacterium]HQL69906.1 bifunctional diaminohydroxyphosphoribosylaminopyrimidine deaminase/5-amino-6-(5-phosphoribosylamino)uracil reductase RibD [Bacteroidales bacterium]
MAEHEKYMLRCLQLAGQGRGHVSPNPLVGCVVVHNGVIIGEGYHRKYGGPHAEVNALMSVANSALLPESTLYVNLEPCSHFGKTPPCADLIISYAVKRVVVSASDLNPLVAGRGIKKLQDAGIEVIQGILKQESLNLNARFYTFHQQRRPYVILKWAQSADGFIDKLRQPDDGQKPQWITNDYCRRLVHKWRTEEDAFLVGTHTAILDNPQLTARLWYGRQPLRVAIDYNASLPATLHIFDKTAPSLLFCNTMRSDAEVEIIDLDNHVAAQICERLYARGIQSLVVEGGRRTLDLFIEAGLWDEARIFTGPASFGAGVHAPELHQIPVSESVYGNTLLSMYKNAVPHG